MMKLAPLAYCREPEPIVVRRAEAEDRRFADYMLRLSTWENQKPTLAIVGVPTDEGVRRNGGRVGAAGAPAAIRAALAKMTASFGSERLPDTVAILDCGDIVTDGLSLEEIHRRQQEIVGALLDEGMTVIVLGGGHDIALPDGRAIGMRAQQLGIVNVDAHLDVRPPTAEGTHSGSPFRELLDDSPCTIAAFVEFGIQPFSASAHHVQYVCDRGYTVWMLDQIRHHSLHAALDEVMATLAGCDRIHLSLDMDSLASAYAPGVSAPASDGFRPDEVAAIVERITQMPTCCLLDIVEVNPLTDSDGRTARLAAYFAALAIWTFAHRTPCH